MRDPLKDKGRLQHMLAMARTLSDERFKHSIEDILQDRILFYGLSKMVEIIGEAAYKITKEYKDSTSEIPWRSIEGMRHILVHGYFTIRPEILWDVINNDIPGLIPHLEKCISSME